MRITKFGHACVRIEVDDQVVVLDPGGFTEAEAVDGATAVLVTHEHPDHYAPDHLRRTTAPIHTIAAVADRIHADAPDIGERISVVAPGERFDAGITVTAVGEQHAVIHPEIPRITNSGYLLEVGDLVVFHPGDALTLPGVEVDLLLLPVSAPWLKISECIDFAREVGAQRSLGIHDEVYSKAGLAIADAHLGRMLAERAQSYVRLESGQDL